MQLSNQAIKEFAAIWAEDHPGEPIDPVQLEKAAKAVLEAVRLLYNDSS